MAIVDVLDSFLTRSRPESALLSDSPSEVERFTASKGFTLQDFGSYASDLISLASGAGGWQGVYQFQPDFYQRLTDTLQGDDQRNYAQYAALTLGNPFASACIRLISESISSLEWKMVRTTAGDKRIERDDHSLLTLFQETGFYDTPGTKRTKLSLWEPIIHHLHFAGELFILLGNENSNLDSGYMPMRLEDRKPPLSFTIMHPMWFKSFIRDKSERIVGYEFNVVKNNKSQLIRSNADQVLHIKRYNPNNQERGLPLAHGAYTSLIQSRMAAKWNTNLSKTGGRVQGFFSPKGLKPGKELSRERVRAIENYLDETLRNRQDRNLPMVMSGAMEYLANTVTPREADFMENDKLNGRKICSALKVPSILAGDVDSQGLGGGSATKQADKLLWRNCLLPIVKDFIDEMNVNVVPRYNDRFKLMIDVSEIDALQEDLTEKWKRIALGTGGPWMVPNDARKLTGFERRTDQEAFDTLGKQSSNLSRTDDRNDHERDSEPDSSNDR